MYLNCVLKYFDNYIFSEEPTDAESKTSNTESMSNSKPKKNGSCENDGAITRTRLLMSLNQMIIHNYPLPINKRQLTMDGYRFTRSHYSPVSDESPMYAIDCEMCYTSIGKNELTRVSIVNEQLDVSYL